MREKAMTSNVNVLQDSLVHNVKKVRKLIPITTGSWEANIFENTIFTITSEIHARSLANFYCQYADRHMNSTFMRRVSEREPAIRQFVIVKNKLMPVFNASVLLLIMNFVITLSK